MRDTLSSLEYEGQEEKKPVSPAFRIFSPENVWAFVLFLIVIALIVFTTDDSPVWIYQGF